MTTERLERYLRLLAIGAGIAAAIVAAVTVLRRVRTTSPAAAEAV